MTSSNLPAITMPKWGLTMTEGKIVGWLKQPGRSLPRARNALKAGDFNRLITRFP